MNIDLKSLKMLEKTMKMMKKYGISHLILPDGTQLVAASAPSQLVMAPKPVSKPVFPVNEANENVDVRFAAVLPKPQNDFSRFRTSNLLKNDLVE